MRGRHRNEERGREAVVDLSDERCELSPTCPHTRPLCNVAWCHDGYDSVEADLLYALFHVRDTCQPPEGEIPFELAGPRCP